MLKKFIINALYSRQYMVSNTCQNLNILLLGVFSLTVHNIFYNNNNKCISN